MKITLLGTGSPPPSLERAGPSQILEIDGQSILVDCGPGTTYQLLKAGIHLAQVKQLFFTHHHMDHNVDFPHFLIASWGLGRRSLGVFGPRGTREWVEAFLRLYEEDIRQRMTLGRPEQGMFDIKFEELQNGSEFAGEGWEVKAIKARHNTLTLSYRFTSSGKSVVISGDTGYFEDLIRFARCADLLVLECTMGKSIELPEEQIKEDDLYKSYKRSRDPKVWQALHEGYGHHTPEEAGLAASQAGVKKLVLTHISPFRDIEDMKRQAKKNFSGEVIIGEDLMTIEI